MGYVRVERLGEWKEAKCAARVALKNMIHLLAQFPGNALSAVLIGSQLVHCLITGSVPVIGGAVLRSERPGFYSLVVALLSGISGLQVVGIHM